MTTLSSSPLSTTSKRSFPRCRELKRHLDRFRDQLEQRGIRIDEVIGTEQFYCIHRIPERDGRASPQAPAGCVEEEAGSYALERWKCDPDKLITTIEKGFDKVAINLASLRAERESLKQQLAQQAGATGREKEDRHVLKAIHKELSRIGREFGRLEAENADLKKRLADQILAVGNQVAPEFLKCIMTIVATGSVHKAAQVLGIPNSTLADRLNRYREKGGLYRLLYDLLAVRRKAFGTRRLEHFNEEYLCHQRTNPRGSEADLIRDVINALEEQDAENWPAIRDELLNILKGHA